jgi:hypothetical protein
MASEPTVLRRYTPPTCTLEIAAQQSPLSRWMGKLALKDLRFKLKLDDPRLADQDWVVLRGDQGQLESLVGAVGDYVQNFLSQSQGSYSNAAVAPKTAVANAAGIALEPFGMLSHQLRLGNLATADSGDSITLSSTQLADLASALDDYNAEATAIPSLARPNLKALNWGAIAAGGIVAVGLSASLLQGLDRSRRSTPTQEASSGDQRVALQPSAPPSPSPTSILGSPPPLGTLNPPTGITVSPNNATPAATGSTSTPNNATPSTPPEVPTIPVTEAPAGGKVEVRDIPQPANKPNSPADPPKNATKQTADNVATGLPKLEAAPVEAIKPDASMASRRAPIAPPAPAPAPVLSSNVQSREVEQRLKAKWQAPPTMTEDAEYRVQVGADGKSQAITPMNDAARKVIDYSGLPLEGEDFVAPNPDQSSSTMRVILGKNGSVNVFLE